MIAKLEMFIALAREAHFGRAAESLGITQPTLSTGIRQLEAQLGVTLVLRGSRYGGLTPEGERALIWARRIVGDSRRLREEMRFAGAGLTGRLRIAVIPTALSWASRLAAHLAQAHPQLDLVVLSRTSAEILAMLENFEAEAGISYLDQEPMGHVASEFLYRESYVLICRADHPLAGRARLGWAEIAPRDLCLLTPDMQNRRIIDGAFRAAGLAVQPALETNSTLVLVSQVEEAGMITVLPGPLASFLVRGRGLACIALESAGPGPSVGLVAPVQEPRGPLQEAVFAAARALVAQDKR